MLNKIFDLKKEIDVIMKKVVRFIKKNYIYIIFVICMILFLSLVEDVYEKELINIDVLAYEFFIESLALYFAVCSNCCSDNFYA